MNFCAYCNEVIFKIMEHWKTDRHKDNVRLEIRNRIEKHKEKQNAKMATRSINGN